MEKARKACPAVSEVNSFFIATKFSSFRGFKFDVLLSFSFSRFDSEILIDTLQLNAVNLDAATLAPPKRYLISSTSFCYFLIFFSL